MRSGFLRGLVLLAALAAWGSDARAQALSDDSSDHLIKAGFVYNFVKLVEWPPAVAGQRSLPIVIGVLGNTPFATTLDRVVYGKTLEGRSFIVKRLKNQEFIDCQCHILFVELESARLEEIIRFQETASVLTISEAPDFARRGGMIAFVLHDSKVRFEVNVEAAKQAALTISSRLLSLATIVATAR